MKCSVCGKEACFSIPVRKSGGLIDYYDYRCKEHLFMGRASERKHSTKLKKNRRLNV